MLKKIKQKSLQRQIVKNINSRDISQVNSKVATLGFLVDEKLHPDFEVLHDFSKKLNLLAKDVSVFSFVESKRKIPSLRQDQVYNKDFSWNGSIQNNNAKEFLNKKLDVLIGFYKGKNEYMDVMTAQSKAKFKVGFVDADERLFDLLISVPISKPVLFAEELKKYLTILNKL